VRPVIPFASAWRHGSEESGLFSWVSQKKRLFSWAVQCRPASDWILLFLVSLVMFRQKIVKDVHSYFHQQVGLIFAFWQKKTRFEPGEKGLGEWNGLEITLYLVVWIRIWPFELKTSYFLLLGSKNPKKILKFSNFIPHPINTPPWFELISHPFYHIFSLFFTHTMSSSKSTEMEDQLTIVF
jgi:hypothetical protein